MVEWEAIESWLELELGVSVRSELMIAAGPEIVRVTGENSATYLGVELALDYMFWQSRRVGLWLEPSYEIAFRHGASHALAGTGGLIVG